MYRGRCEVGSHQVVVKDSRDGLVIVPISSLPSGDRKYDSMAALIHDQCGVALCRAVVGSAQEGATVRIAVRREIEG